MFTCIGARNYALDARQTEDFYATDPVAVYDLLEREKFSEIILEPCVGMGHIAGVLEAEGHKVIAQDIVDRGWHNTVIKNFMTQKENSCDIITNPPYFMAKEIIEHALDISPEGTKIAMFLKLTFMESIGRKALFEKYPFERLYVYSHRRCCAKNGEFGKYLNTAVAYGWYVWNKGYKGDPVIKWI